MHDNLRHLGLDVLDVVNVRLMGAVHGPVVCVQNMYNVAHRPDDALVDALAAQAWLLQRSPNILLIPGTSSVAHLHENLRAAALQLPADSVARLNAIGAPR